MIDSSQVRERTFSWGVVGTNRWEALRLDRSIDRDGVVRGVDKGVKFVLDFPGTAEVDIPFPRWRKRPDNNYEMDLGESDKPKITTLADLRDDLQKKKWRGGESLLRDLDTIATQLLRIAGGLHKQGFGVGLLRPDSVILLRRGDGTLQAVILPDFGFVRFRGVLPEWMRPDTKFRLLWDKSPEWMNERCFDRLRHPKLAKEYAETADRVEGKGFDPQMDLRTIARLLAWVLAPDGKVRREIPDRDQAKWSKAEVWAVLKDATDEKKKAFADAEAFAQALNEESAKPSRHFIEQIKAPPKPRRRWRWVAPTIGGLVLLGVVAFVAYIIGPPPKGLIDPLCPDCPPSSKLRPLLVGYAQSEKNPFEEAKVLEKMFDAAILSTSTDKQKLERDCRNLLMNATLAGLASQGTALLEAANRTHMARSDFKDKVAALQELYIRLVTLRDDRAPTPEEFKQWLKDLSKILSRPF